MLRHPIDASDVLDLPATEQELSSKPVKRWITRPLASNVLYPMARRAGVHKR